jgi:hypothetical protein
MQSTLYLSLIFQKETPKFVIDFFMNGKNHAEIPAVLHSFRFTFDNSCNIAGKTQMLCQPSSENHYLTITHYFDFENDEEVGNAYWLIGGLAQYAKDNKMAGFISNNAAGTSIFGYKDQLPFWKKELFINFNLENSYIDTKFEQLCTLGHQIMRNLTNESALHQLLKEFDCNISRPNGSNLFFYPENYDARKDDLSNYNPTVAEVVKKCLDYKVIKSK